MSFSRINTSWYFDMYFGTSQAKTDKDKKADGSYKHFGPFENCDSPPEKHGVKYIWI